MDYLMVSSSTRSKYGENKERFTYTYCLVFFQCIANTIVSKGLN